MTTDKKAQKCYYTVFFSPLCIHCESQGTTCDLGNFPLEKLLYLTNYDINWLSKYFDVITLALDFRNFTGLDGRHFQMAISSGNFNIRPILGIIITVFLTAY